MRLLSYYLPNAPVVLVYMLQQTEYQPRYFFRWVLRAPDLRRVMIRQRLVYTKKARLLLSVTVLTYVLQFGVSVWLLTVEQLPPAALLSAALAPVAAILVLAVTAWLARGLIIGPLEGREIARAQQKLNAIPAERIAVLGSFGKTTMKHLLETVLSEGLNVAATPGNMNVRISHARWINQRVSGEEDVLILEFGEAYPGDIELMALFVKPSIAVVTGLAPAHLEEYGSTAAVAEDFKSVLNYAETTFGNAESPALRALFTSQHEYGIGGVDGWAVSNIVSTIEGTSFTLRKNKRELKLASGLIGLHQIGPLCAVVAIAERLGLRDEQIIDGIAKTKPFDHRMRPYRRHDAWIIDDTYNGNIEGARAGLKLLNELRTAGRKIYVTPGFVEQGGVTEQVHEELGRLIAESAPDIVVLMKNSTTAAIQKGLDDAEFAGELIIEAKPLEFYTNLDHYVAKDDIVLMQNDWTDYYQ